MGIAPANEETEAQYVGLCKLRMRLRGDQAIWLQSQTYLWPQRAIGVEWGPLCEALWLVGEEGKCEDAPDSHSGGQGHPVLQG